MTDLKIFAKTIEQEAIEQIYDITLQESFLNSKIRIMPDTHAGKGCVIGFTGTYSDKIIPSLVGVDLSCGMFCVNLGKVNIDLKILDKIINEQFALEKGQARNEVYEDFDFSQLKMYNHLKQEDYLLKSIGTLGSGNHFIELDKDSQDNIYLVVHSGSRNLGVQVANYYQQLAILNVHKQQTQLHEAKQQLIVSLKNQGRQKEIQQALQELEKEYSKEVNTNIPNDLCWLDGQDMQDYLHDIEICKEYANLNRWSIVSIILNKYFNETGELLKVKDAFTTLHNYVDVEHKIIRKGAVSAYKNEKLLIPLNMKDGSIIAIGKGNEDWNCSAPHGAGRKMSRSKAKETLNIEDYQKSMKDVYTTSVVVETLDEAPMAYKSSEEILDLIKDTVNIIEVIKPIYNFKNKE